MEFADSYISVLAKPFEVQVKRPESDRFRTMPGCWFVTEAEARDCLKRNKPDWQRMDGASARYRVHDARHSLAAA